MKHLFFILLIFISSRVFSQEENKILARIGNNTITVKEFSDRYQLSPQKKNFDNGKKGLEEFLYTLIAENLFAQEAIEKGLDTSLTMQTNFEPLKKMFLRDGLYKSEISKKVKINPTKFKEGLKLADKKVKADFIFSESKDKINLIYSELINSNNLDSVIQNSKNIDSRSDVKEIAYGDVAAEIEQILFSQNKNTITEPIKTPEGCYIFRIVDILPNKLKSGEDKINLVKKVLQERAEDSVFNNFWNSFFNDKKVKTSGTLFWYFVDNFYNLIISEKEKNNIQEKKKINIPQEKIIELKSKLNTDSLNSIFINIGDNPLTLNDFINDFAYEGFYTYSTDKKVIATQIKSRVKRQIEMELLTRAAEEKGIAQLSEVKNSTNIWKNHTLATLLKRKIFNKTNLTLQEIDSISINPFSDNEFKIIELLSDDLILIKKFLELSDNDDSLKIITKKYSKRKNELNEEGELGFFTFNDYGEIGRVVSTMNVGEIYGPLETPDGYSVFKLIKIKKNEVNISKNNIDKNLLNKLRYNKIVNKLENLAVDLADKYKISVNEELLNKLQITNQQMVVFQNIGFGGKVLAFPYTTPFFKWKEKLEQKSKNTL